MDLIVSVPEFTYLLFKESNSSEKRMCPYYFSLKGETVFTKDLICRKAIKSPRNLPPSPLAPLLKTTKKQQQQQQHKKNKTKNRVYVCVCVCGGGGRGGGGGGGWGWFHPYLSI